jgi:hypothetical protein
MLKKEVRPTVDLELALPATWTIDTAYQLDTDRDGDTEWVICYTFDNLENQAFVPIRCAIYDMGRREPKLPVFYPYHLQAPGWTYLGEGTKRVSVRLQNVISSTQTTTNPDIRPEFNEVVVTNAGPSGFVNRVSIFQWHDNIPSDLRKRTDPHEVLVMPNQPPSSGEWYECIGMFKSTFRVEIGINRVTVIERLNDRSQLARIDYYEYDAGRGLEGYLDQAQQLVQPASSCISFALGIPSDVAESPYPEKIVMAFQRTFNRVPDYGESFLSTDGRQSRSSGCLGEHFAKTAKDVCVKLISYGPPSEVESEVRAFGQANDQRVTDLQVLTQNEVTTQDYLDTSDIQAQVDTLHTISGETREIKVRWTLVRQGKTEGEQGTSTVGQWKIVEACEVVE